MSLIAILDDQETNRRIFERLASSIEDGITIRVYGDPQIALTEFQAGLVPDLIVTDYKMPSMDGAGFIRSLRTLNGFFRYTGHCHHGLRRTQLPNARAGSGRNRFPAEPG